MASDEAPAVSPQPGDTSVDQLEESLADQQLMALMKTASIRSTESDHESQSSDSGGNETGSDNSGHLKVAVAAALATISYDFGQSTIKKTCLTSMESYAHYFPKGYYRPPSAESMPEPRANEDVVFEDFFTTGLQMPPHPVLVDILRMFRVQLHKLTPNAIVQISKFIWVVTSCGDWPTADVFPWHYELHY
jgi:hypothetical protein